MRLRRPVTALATTAVVATTLAGCVRLDSATTLNADDTFDQHAIIAAAPEALTALRQQLGSLPEGTLPEGTDPEGTLPEGTLPEGTDPEDALAGLDLETLLDPDTFREQLAPLEEARPGSVTVEPYEDQDGREGVECTVTDVPLAEVDDAAGTMPLTGAVGIAREGDAYVVTLSPGAAAQLEGLGAQESQLRLIENAVDVAVSFTFPGLVTEATAGEVAGNTVTLGLGDLLATDTIRIVGGAHAQLDWGPILRWGGVALAIAAVLGGATLLVLQDRRRRAAHLPPPRAAADDGPGTLPHEEAPEG